MWNLPGAVSRAASTSRYWPQRCATTTSPMFRAGFTPPAMPLNTTWLTLKRSRANCVFIAALVMLTPLRNSTTGLPCSVPVVNSTPLRVRLCGCSTRLCSSASSAGKAEMIAMRGVSSGETPGAAQPASVNVQAATMARIHGRMGVFLSVS